MSRATPQMRNFARRLMDHEPGANNSSGKKTPPAFPVPEKLRPHLATLMGNGGFQALLARALALAKTEVSWLRALHVKADGSLGGLEDLHTQPAPDELIEAREVLLAQLLGLLVAFIGEDLTFRLMREVWPKVSLNGLSLDNHKSKNEKAK